MIVPQHRSPVYTTDTAVGQLMMVGSISNPIKKALSEYFVREFYRNERGPGFGYPPSVLAPDSNRLPGVAAG